MSVISWLRLLGPKLNPGAAVSDPSRAAHVTAPPLRYRRATRGRHQATIRRRSQQPTRRLRSEVLETRNLLSLLVSTAEDSGPGSLREAIDVANSSAGPDEIRFSLPAGSVIQALTALPALSDTSGGATIDGDVNGDQRPDIVIRGTGTFDLVLIRSSDNVVRNLVVQNGRAGIHIYGGGSAADRNQVFGCYIGTSLTGMEVTGTANGGSGVWVGGITHGTIIGGPGAHEGNVISGNSGDGIVLDGEAASGSTIQGNFIGTNATGTAALGNSWNGMSVGSSNNLIGGPAAGARNVISGNGLDGVTIWGREANRIEGNYIGTNAAGDAALGNRQHGVRLWTSGNTIGGTAAGAGNVISGNSGDGIVLDGEAVSGNTIQGNFIGTNATGTAALGNSWNGMSVGSSNNLIGGPAAGARNVISGNGLDGVRIWGREANRIEGNYIGTNAAGDAALGNRQHGVRVGTSGNTIGGTAAGARNVISGNSWNGISLDSGSRNIVQGNFIGTNAAGTAALGNGRVGVDVGYSTSSNDTIGGTAAGAGNVISGNGMDGIRIEGSTTGTIVEGNLIGTNATGDATLGNHQHGVRVWTSGNSIGGTAAGAGNVISGNAWAGIVLEGSATSGNVIQGNFIGTNATGTATLGNGRVGVEVFTPNNTIGGDVAGARNVISGNGSDGVRLAAGEANRIQGNRVFENEYSGIRIDGPDDCRVIGNTSIDNGGGGIVVVNGATQRATLSRNITYGNSRPGIDLNGDGFSLNDPGDLDAGPNTLLNWPELQRSAGAAIGSLRLAGKTVPGGTVEFFQTDSLYGTGDARVFLDSITADGAGHFTYDVPVRQGGVTATATDRDGNTSEFSPIVPTASGAVDAEYLLITSEALAASFQPLVDRRTAQGKPGTLVTVEWITAHYDGTRPDGSSDIQTAIRNCVRDYYEQHGTQWLCLGGDETVVPVRILSHEANEDGPSDLYYGSLTGTWDSNANGVYAGAGDQDVDVHPQVMVGRIPVRTVQQVQDYIVKLVTYENSDPADYSRTLLLAGSNGPAYLTGTTRASDQRDHELISRSEQLLRSQYWQMVQPVGQMAQVDDFENTFTRWDTNQAGDYELSYEHLVDRLDWGYETVILHGHGNPSAWGGETANVDTNMAAVLTNASRPSIFLVVSCSTAAFDLAEPNLAEALLRNSHGGAVAYLGGVRAMDMWDTPLPLAICERILEGVATLGQAAAWDSLGWAGGRVGDRLNVALLGDPALQLLPAPGGRHLEMLSPVNCEVVDSDSPMLVRWNAGGTGFAVGEEIKLEYSSDSGQTWQTIAGAAALPYNARSFSWDITGLPDGRHYRVRVTALSDPSATDASRRDFRIADMGLLTVRMSPPGPWFDPQGNQLFYSIDGNCANGMDYNYSVPVGDIVTLTAPEVAGCNFIGWEDGQGNLLTNQATYTWTFSADQTVVVAYEYVAGPTVTGIADDTGFSVSDGVTNDRTLVMFGKAAGNSTVTVLQNGTSIGTAIANGSGAWSLDYSGTTMPPGSYNLTATDATGNTGHAFRMVIDATAPAAPAVTGIAADTGVWAADGITSNQSLVICGTAEANSTVTVFKNGASIGTTLADVYGAWNFDYRRTALPQGSYSFTATATDAAGNMSVASAVFTVVIDTTAPGSPVITGIAADTGASGTDGVTSDGTLVLTGTAEPGDSVTVFVGAASTGTVTATVPGVWTFDYTGTTLAEGTYQFTARATDPAGYTSPDSEAFTVTVDTTGPTAGSLEPGDNTTAVGLDTDLMVTFNEDIQKGTGEIVLKRSSDHSTVETIAVSSAAVAVAGNTVTIARSVTLGVLTDYYVEVAAGALEDLAGNDFAGLSGAAAWNFTTETFRVAGLHPTASGLVAAFNAPFATTLLNLYDGAEGSLGAPDVTVLDGAGKALAGSLVVDDNPRNVEWVATGNGLPPGTYAVSLRSGTWAFRDTAGNLLDGDTDGTSGGGFSSPLTIPASLGRVVSIPDMARGAGQSVNIPNSAAGLPIRLDNAAGVTSLAVDLVYDQTLLAITAAALAASLPGDWTVVSPPDTSTPGMAKIRASGTTPLAGTNVEIVRLTAAVPDDAPYGAVQAIRLENVSLNGGGIAAVGDVAVHKAVYLGDADGSGIHSAADAFLTVQTALGLASGFAAHAWTDPRIVGDADGSGVLSAADAFLIVQEGLGQSEPFVPDNPHITVTPVGGGVDPQFRIGVNLPASAGGLVSLPVQLAIEPAARNVGALDFDLFFDASRLTIPTLAGISAGADTAGWAVTAILVAPGQLRVGMVSATGRPLAVGLREIARLQFRVEAEEASGTGWQPVPDGLPTPPTRLRPITDLSDGSETHPTLLDIEPVDPRAGGYTWTAVDGGVGIPAGGVLHKAIAIEGDLPSAGSESRAEMTPLADGVRDQLLADWVAEWLPLAGVLDDLAWSSLVLPGD